MVPPRVPAEERDDWVAAHGVLGLGSLTAEWLQGRRQWCPTSSGQPDPSTTPAMVDAMRAANGIGMVTASSQPGSAGSATIQRAYVTAFALPSVALAAERLALGSDLVVNADHRGVDHWATSVLRIGSIAVSARDGHAVRHLDDWPTVDQYIAHASLNAQTAAHLQETVRVEVMDPLWGRDHVVWQFLHQLAGYVCAMWGADDDVRVPE